MAVAYFYTEQGVPLRDYNQLYYSSDGNVAAIGDFTPSYDITLYDDSPSGIKILLPYSELHLQRGYHKLKYKVILFDDNLNQIVASPYYSFNYTQN